jgi:hypothetical protein
MRTSASKAEASPSRARSSREVDSTGSMTGARTLVRSDLANHSVFAVLGRRMPLIFASLSMSMLPMMFTMVNERGSLETRPHPGSRCRQY